MRNIKNQGGRRQSPQEVADIREIHRCPQCNFTSMNKTARDQHMKEGHENHPSCPFCFVGFKNHHYLRKHIDQAHEELTLQKVPVQRSGDGQSTSDDGEVQSTSDSGVIQNAHSAV